MYCPALASPDIVGCPGSDNRQRLSSSPLLCLQAGRGAGRKQPQLLFPSSPAHHAGQEACMLAPELLWALSPWLPDAQTEARFAAACKLLALRFTVHIPVIS